MPDTCTLENLLLTKLRCDSRDVKLIFERAGLTTLVQSAFLHSVRSFANELPPDFVTRLYASRRKMTRNLKKKVVQLVAPFGARHS